MKNYNLSDLVLSQVGSYVYGLDKEAIEERAKVARINGIAKAVEKAETMIGADKVLAFQSIELWKQAKAGYIQLPIFLDWCSSGASLISAFTRDEKGMESCGVFNIYKPGNLYGLVTELLNEKLGLELTRAEVKLFCIPFYYGGDANVAEALGDDAETFHEVYSELLPGAYAFRQATVDSWNENVDHYAWLAADGSEIYIPVLQDSKLMTVDINKHSYKCHFKIKGPRPLMIEGSTSVYRNNHTKGNGANMVHHWDAGVLREIIGMSHITKEEALKILKKTKHNLQELYIDMANDETLERMLTAWEEYNFPSVRWFYELRKFQNSVVLPYELWNQLYELANRLGDYKFEVMTIHDEFGCLPIYVNDLRRYANTIYANIYRSNTIKYFNKVFGMNIPVGEFKQETYDRLLEVDCLLS